MRLFEELADMGRKLAQLGNKPDMLGLIAAWRRAAPSPVSDRQAAAQLVGEHARIGCRSATP